MYAVGGITLIVIGIILMNLKRWNNLNKIKNNIYVIYTIFFTAMFFAVYYIFINMGKSFIWSHDGFTQYYICLYYFNDIIREFIGNPTSGLPMFTWNIGTGVDIIGTFSCNMVGDIPSYISLLFPMKNMVQAYNFIVVIRMYLVRNSISLLLQISQKWKASFYYGSYNICVFFIYDICKYKASFFYE